MISKMKAVFIIAPFVVLLVANQADSQVFHSLRGLLSSQFQDSERVAFVEVRPRGSQRRQIESRLGHRLEKDTYTFYVARTHGRVDGYALFDEERGQHEDISLATFFDATGHVTHVEVVAYREPHGDGIRRERFRRQFVGRDASSGFRPDSDIDTISGSTISVRSMCRAVKRASVLLSETVLAPGGAHLARR